MMKIDWSYENFESGLRRWTTDFRGFSIELRSDPRTPEGMVHVTVSPGKDYSQKVWMDPDPATAMISSLKWVNGYWDLLEDGPVEYEVMEIPEDGTV
jgi:hypothetical protein